MTCKIRLLSEETINQIAAGEVVERPASVVKELVENSLDSGASIIEVRLVEGGRQLIEVSDNGSGMSAEELKMAVMRHATSKIKAISDLDSIRTMGFRGEAMASIASVAHLTIISRPPDAEMGHILTFDEEGAIKIAPIGAPVGTLVRVENLFYNTPARQKFLRQAATERSHIVETVLRLAMGARHGTFKVTEDERRLLMIHDNKDEYKRVKEALEGMAKNGLYRLPPASYKGLTVSGYFAPPQDARRDNKALYVYVNGRMVRDRLLQGAVREGYRTLLPHDRQPVALIYLETDDGLVDVNVHPQKLEVRFSAPQDIYALIGRTLAKALALSPWLKHEAASVAEYKPQRLEEEGSSTAFLPYTPAASAAPAGKKTIYDFERVPAKVRPLISEPYSAALDRQVAENYNELLPEENSGYFATLEYKGQLARTYLLCEDKEGNLVIIDQHAAHERIRRQELAARPPDKLTQPLLFPEIMDLPANDYHRLAPYFSLLADLGIEVEPFGAQQLVVNSLPPGMKLDKKRIYELLQAIAISAGEDSTSRPIQDIKDHILATMACHSAVRAGDLLSEAEAVAILQKLDHMKAAPFCPHGRSIMMKLTRAELEKGVNRRV